MNFVASIYGRLGRNIRPIQTKSGKPMTVASLAVTVSCGDDEETVWIGLVAFGKQADRLLEHNQGEMLAATGQIQVNRWTDSQNQTHKKWQMVVESIVSARLARPSAQSSRPRLSEQADAFLSDFDDDLPR